MCRRVQLILGGVRSGKSRRALELAGSQREGTGGPVFFIATAEPIDQEMERRIQTHQAERDPAFVTVEAPRSLTEAILALPCDAELAVVDCLTVWLGNLLHHYSSTSVERLSDLPEAPELVRTLRAPPLDLILVANEVGMGVVPATPLGRQFRDLAGELNREVAASATHVELVVAGLPLCLKAPGQRLQSVR